jgi:hypothetical protein
MMRDLEIPLEMQRTLMRHSDIKTTLGYGGKTPAEHGRTSNDKVVEMLRKKSLVPYKAAPAKRKYSKEWMAERRAEWFATNGPRVDCRSTESLQLSYVKERGELASAIWTYSEAKQRPKSRSALSAARPATRGNIPWQPGTAHETASSWNASWL